MKLSARARCALHLVCEVGRTGGDGRPVKLSAIAARSGLSRRFLEQLALALRNSSLVRGVSGRSGGYLLSRPASEITVGQVLRAAIGPIRITPCTESPPACIRSDICACRLVWMLVDARIKEVLDEFTIADMLSGRLASEGGHEAPRA